MAKMSIIPKRLLRLGVLEAVSQKHSRNQQVPKPDSHDITDFADFAELCLPSRAVSDVQ
jgi:hypothetical protein